jgi:hypothetical protein
MVVLVHSTYNSASIAAGLPAEVLALVPAIFIAGQPKPRVDNYSWVYLFD